MNRGFILTAPFTCIMILWMTGAVLAHEHPEQQAAKPRFTISRETTFVTGPLRTDGSVDFAAAVNARSSEGVTPTNNACVLLYQALGPIPEEMGMSAALFEGLQMAPPPSDGQYLQTFGEAFNDRKLTDDQQNRLDEQFDAAMSRPWSRREFPDIADWLDQNEEPLRVVHAATRRERFYAPLIVDYEDTEAPAPLVAVLLPWLDASRTASRLLCTRAMLHLDAGDTEAAWKDLLASYRLGRLVGMGATVIEGLVGYDIESRTTDRVLTLIRETSPTAALARQYREALDAMPPIATMSEKVDFAGRCACLDALLVMAWNREDAVELLEVGGGLGAIGRIINTFSLNSTGWDATLRTSNTWYDRIVAAFELRSYAERRQALDKLHAELSSLVTRMKDRDTLRREITSDAARDTAIARIIGGVVVAQLLPDLDRARMAEDRVRQRTRNLEVALALAAFHADHGRYPQNLAELEPKYIPHLPVDIFSDQTLIYRRQDTGYLLYSIGRNSRDDDGRSSHERPAGDDLAVRMTGARS